MTEKEQWDAFFEYAGALKAAAASPTPGAAIVGRSISGVVKRLANFWADHKETLIPVLGQLAIAAIEALIAAQSDFDAVNPPGPR